MKFNLAIHIILLCLCFNLKTKAQGVKSPTPMVLFEKATAYNNASLLEKNNGLHFGSQGQFGAFSAIRTIYGFGSIALGSKADNGLGFAIYSFQEGELLAENRLKISYWKRIELNPSTDIIAAGQAGLINASYKATRSTSGANTFTPNFDFGLTLRKENTSLSLSINQLSSPTASPLTQTNFYNTFYTAIVSHQLDLSAKVSLTGISNYYHTVSLKPIIEAKTNILYNELIETGAGFGSNGFLFSIGITQLSEDQLPLGLYFGYRLPLSNSILNTFQPYQIHLNYLLYKK